MQKEQREQQITLSPHVQRLLTNYCRKTGMYMEEALAHLIEQEAARPFVNCKSTVEKIEGKQGD